MRAAEWAIERFRILPAAREEFGARLPDSRSPFKSS
jgi:hypothetical protein